MYLLSALLIQSLKDSILLRLCVGGLTSGDSSLPQFKDTRNPSWTAKIHSQLHSCSQKFAQKPITRGQGRPLVSYNSPGSPLPPPKSSSPTES